MSQQPAVNLNDVENPAKANDESQPPVKRRQTKKRSGVWIYYEDVIDDITGATKSKCKYCGKEYFSSTSQHGTGSLWTHIKNCQAYKATLADDQTRITFTSDKMVAWKFDQKASRDALSYMIIVDELPFSFVEGKGYRHYSSITQPQFKVPCRTTVTKDVLQMFEDEKKKVRDLMKKNKGRICLTTDSSTSQQKINYMSLTAHFVDNDWKLTKKVLNFCLLDSHRGAEIGKAVELCLIDWGIDNVMTISVDNASSNDVAIDYLKKKFTSWPKTLLKGKWLHIRCMAHILNLVVQDGISYVGDSVNNIRAAVKWVRQSNSRISNFKKYAAIEKCGSTKSLVLDIATRWNYTYLMLETAQVYEEAFNRYDSEDTHFAADLAKLNFSVPSEYDWNNARKLSGFLKHFFDVTEKISGTLYVTSHMFLDDMTSIFSLLHNDLASMKDMGLLAMLTTMKLKFNKYFGVIEKANMLLYIATVLDPTNKLVYLDMLLVDVYGKEDGTKLRKVVEDALRELYDEYVNIHGSSTGSSTSSCLGKRPLNNESVSNPTMRAKLREKMKMQMSGSLDSKNELDKYLSEVVEDESDKVDILLWWKVNEMRFPILSLMARDILAIPVSTVASESVFSTSGRVLDAFRSSLTPNVIEALICTQDWLLRSSCNPSVEEDFDRLTLIQEEVASGSAYQV